MGLPVELFSKNLGSTTVASGGTTAPASGTVETWTVASSSSFPAASNAASPPTQFHVQENDSQRQTEIIAVTNVSGTTWTVVRGDEGTTPVAHPAGFTVVQTITAEGLTALLNNAGVYLEALVKQGTAAVATNTMPPGLRVPIDCTLANAYIWVGTAPTGSALTVLVRRAGSTIATLTVAAGSTTGSATGLSVALTKGDLITFDVSAVGSTVAGADVAVELEAY